MDKTPFYSFDAIEPKEIAPGFISRLIHTTSNTINFIQVKAGNMVPLHKHHNEQYAFVIEGQFELTIEDEVQILNRNSFAIIPPDVLHSGIAITDCKLIDIFSPPREDYKLL